MNDKRFREALLRAFEAGWDAHEKFAEPEIRDTKAAAWEEGFDAHVEECAKQRHDKSYPITRVNPHVPGGGWS